MSAKHGLVVQGFFLGGRPAWPRQHPVPRASIAPGTAGPQGGQMTPSATRASQAPVVQRRGHGDAFQLPDNFSNLGSHGQPLPAAVREKMESAFGGASFDDVRIHVGPQASSICVGLRSGQSYFAPGT